MDGKDDKDLGADAAAGDTARSAFDPESPQGSSVLQHAAWTRNGFLNYRDTFRVNASRARRRFSERHSHYHAAQFVASVYNEVAELFQSRIDDLDRAQTETVPQPLSEASPSVPSAAPKEPS